MRWSDRERNQIIIIFIAHKYCNIRAKKALSVIITDFTDICICVVMRQSVPSHLTVHSFRHKKYVYIYDELDDAAYQLSRMLSDVAQRWIHVGIILGVKWSWIIQRSGRDDDRQNLREMLCHWLESITNVTLQRLVEAVKHSAGGNNYRLAETINNKLNAICIRID